MTDLTKRMGFVVNDMAEVLELSLPIMYSILSTLNLVSNKVFNIMSKVAKASFNNRV